MEPEFRNDKGTGDAEVRLRVIDPIPLRAGRGRFETEYFELLTGFSYVDGTRTFTIKPEMLPETDLASVPFPFRWFVTPGGRHTLPSLLHDCLVAGKCAQAASSGTPPTRPEADDIFKDALTVCGVPIIRRHLMWGAVSFATRWALRGWARVAAAAWVVLAAIGTMAVFVPLIGAAFGLPLWTLAAFVPAGAIGPIVFAFLWGSQRVAGIWFGYGVVLLVPATAIVYLTSKLYIGLEHALRYVLLGWRKVMRTRGKPQPTTPIAPPPSIKQL